MIARVWTARARTEGADGYAAHYREHVLPALSRIDGYKGATLLRRGHGDGVELIVISLWISEDAIRRFAGADISRADEHVLRARMAARRRSAADWARCLARGGRRHERRGGNPCWHEPRQVPVQSVAR